MSGGEMKEKIAVKGCAGVKLQSKGKAAEVYGYSHLLVLFFGIGMTQLFPELKCQ